MRRAPVIVAVTIAAVLAAVYFAWPKSPPEPRASAGHDTPQGEPRTNPSKGSAGIQTTVVATAVPSAAKEDGAHFVPFGEGSTSLGRGTTDDGRPIAPASFLADADGLLVLDQEKRRILRSDGTSIPLPGKHADDIARAKDGSLAVLDRTESKEVTLLDKNGRVYGHLPLEGTGIDDPRDVSRIIVSGDDVLVERNGGGPLLRLGGADGTPAAERTEIQGIPTRDGRYLISAGVTNEEEGRAWVTLADREAVHRWTRELHFPSVLSAVAFLDSDSNGTVWAVLLAGSTPADYVNWAVCLDPATGNLRGSFTLTAENPPWESFRDYAVQDGVGLVAAKRSESGVSYATYACP
ncbi:MAG TPA: hypothetical protein VLM85_09895 [Polyangiaceae bacterium]|nr:hypothetical protein [Polyangiaceae bacterium]